jgi:hypothetical protein
LPYRHRSPLKQKMTHKQKANFRKPNSNKKLRKPDVNQNNSPRELNKAFPLTPPPKQLLMKDQQEAPKAQSNSKLRQPDAKRNNKPHDLSKCFPLPPLHRSDTTGPCEKNKKLRKSIPTSHKKNNRTSSTQNFPCHRPNKKLRKPMNGELRK